MKKKKEIKIVRETEVNYTFLDTGLIDIERESGDVDKTNSSIEKDIIKSRSIDSKKSKIRYKNFQNFATSVISSLSSITSNLSPDLFFCTLHVRPKLVKIS